MTDVPIGLTFAIAAISMAFGFVMGFVVRSPISRQRRRRWDKTQAEAQNPDFPPH